MTMGEYIRTLRKSRGWTQEELGKRLGVQRAAVNKWECGAVENIKRSTIKKLSEIFDVSPCDLMCWDEKRKPAMETEFLNLFRRLDERDQARICERMMTMLEEEKYLSSEYPPSASNTQRK